MLVAAAPRRNNAKHTPREMSRLRRKSLEPDIGPSEAGFIMGCRTDFISMSMLCRYEVDYAKFAYIDRWMTNQCRIRSILCWVYVERMSGSRKSAKLCRNNVEVCRAHACMHVPGQNWIDLGQLGSMSTESGPTSTNVGRPLTCWPFARCTKKSHTIKRA